ncbi:phosphotransferase family protein [Demequina activiva]|uniref:Aminoglycoside phosphotransferase domain-containing protein n=1 Tax=Demequina activiva TaxID=1582364 RepID=A0A919Q0W1_9MICO|nr:aminoglycoside phosphotransferase family protein [Demequina activiva]GIG54097.1 hypothetical protein Dac01nite_08490 [Demequina activiva]
MGDAVWVEGAQIARGATAVVTYGAPGTVVKTLLPGVPSIVVTLEADALRAARTGGLPVPELLGTDVEGQPPSLTLAYVDGPELGTMLETRGAEWIGRELAEIQHQIRSVKAPPPLIGLQTYLLEVIARGPLDGRVRHAVLDRISALPGGTALCHLDLHPRNVIWNGTSTVIDWNNGSRGDPAADVARTRLLLRSIIHFLPRRERSHMRPILIDAETSFAAATERLAPGLLDASRAWEPVIAAMRWGESPPAAERRSLEPILEQIL